MDKFTLIKQHNSDGIYSASSRVLHEFEAVELSDVLFYMESFLRGCGYQFDGYLTIEETKVAEYNEPKLLLEE